MGEKRGSGGRDICIARKKIGRREFLEVRSNGLEGVDLLSFRGPTTKAGSPTCRVSSHSSPIPPSRALHPDLHGVVTLPVAEEGLKSYSCTGDWNLFMNANTRDPAAAHEFIPS
jgi:hypothetical protein